MTVSFIGGGNQNAQRKPLLILELWVTSLSDTPRLQYYDVQNLEF
jgi:hypothetical protein